MTSGGLRHDDDGLVCDDFADPVLELTHLLRQASGIEHSVALAYLYAAFSVKDRYLPVRGSLGPDDYGLRRIGAHGSQALTAPTDLLQAATQEMQHLAYVNEFLRILGSPPQMASYEFPFAADLFPFPIALRALDRPAVATFLWLEADEAKLASGRRRTPETEPAAFVDEVRAEIAKVGGPSVDQDRVDHFGSVYGSIMEVAQRVADAPPAWLEKDHEWHAWIDRMHLVLMQGEISHYLMFRSIFTGAAFTDDHQPDPGIWVDPSSARYPSIALASGTAWRARPHTIQPENARRLAWLGNLHYWILLGMLDLSFRSVDLKLRYAAVDQMTLALWWIGLDLAQGYGVGMPFDQLAQSYAFGRDEKIARRVLTQLVLEAKTQIEKLGADGLLPANYETSVVELALASLQ